MYDFVHIYKLDLWMAQERHFDGVRHLWVMNLVLWVDVIHGQTREAWPKSHL